MGDLHARRDSVESWVSRSTHHATLAGAAVFAVLAFALGIWVGRSTVASVEAPPRVPGGAVLEGVPGDALLTTVAEIQAVQRADGGAEDIFHFPELKTPGAGAALPDALPARGVTDVEIGAGVVSAGVSGSLRGTHAVVVAEVGTAAEAQELLGELASASLDVWIVRRQVDGVPAFGVALGEHTAASGATEAAEAFGTEHAELVARFGEPRVWALPAAP